MKQVKYLIVVAAMFCLTQAHAQGVDLRLDQVIIGYEQNLYKDSGAYTWYLTIFNDSATNFEGIIGLGGKINGVTIPDTTVAQVIHYLNDTVLDTVPALSQVTRKVVIDVSNPIFAVGPSGVVIWPIAVSNPHEIPVRIADSLGFSVNVYPAVGINEIQARNLQVYTVGQQLIIQNHGAYQLKQAELYDLSGRQLRQIPITNSGYIDMGRYAAGVYMVRITFADNTKAAIKVLYTR